MESREMIELLDAADILDSKGYRVAADVLDATLAYRCYMATGTDKESVPDIRESRDNIRKLLTTDEPTINEGIGHVVAVWMVRNIGFAFKTLRELARQDDIAIRGCLTAIATSVTLHHVVFAFKEEDHWGFQDGVSSELELTPEQISRVIQIGQQILGFEVKYKRYHTLHDELREAEESEVQ